MYKTINDREIDRESWSTFIGEHPNGNIFQTPEMFEIYKSTEKFNPIAIGVIDCNDNIVGVLLAVIQKEHNGIIGVLSSRSIIIGGPIIKDDDVEILAFLMKSYNKVIRGKAIYTQIRNLNNQESFVDTYKLFGYNYEPHLDILINLNCDKEQLNKNINKGKKRNLTKSINKNVQFIEISDVKEAKESVNLISSTYKRVKLPMPDLSLFDNAFIQLHKIGYLKIYAAYIDSKIIGVRWALTYKNLIYDWYAGSDDDYNNMYPNDFIILNVLYNGCDDNKYNCFDFGGAGKPGVPYGVRDHKLKFGGELVEYGRFEKTHNHFLMSVAKIGLKIYKIIK